MKKYLQNGHGHRLAGLSIGLIIANLIVSIVVDQFQVPLHPNVVANGTLLLATIINFLVSKHKKKA